jgi:hypothetical protein
MQRLSRVFLRFLAAALAMPIVWGGQILIYTAVAPGASAHDIRVWGYWSAMYCTAALLLVGLPVAALDPAVYLPHRKHRAVVLVGLAGGVLALVPPAGYLFFITVPLGLAAGAGAMAIYIAMITGSPGLFGVAADQ